jgi:hypothetical protein
LCSRYSEPGKERETKREEKREEKDPEENKAGDEECLVVCDAARLL